MVCSPCFLGVLALLQRRLFLCLPANTKPFYNTHAWLVTSMVTTTLFENPAFCNFIFCQNVLLLPPKKLHCTFIYYTERQIWLVKIIFSCPEPLISAGVSENFALVLPVLLMLPVSWRLQTKRLKPFSLCGLCNFPKWTNRQSIYVDGTENV